MGSKRSIKLHLIVGATIGICYLGIVLLSGQLFGWTPRVLELTTTHLANSSKLPAECSDTFPERTPAPTDEFFVYELNGPVALAVQIKDPPTDQNTALFLGPVVDQLHLLICSDDGEQIYTKTIGNKFRLSDRDLASSHLVFELEPELAARELILTVKQDAAVTLPVRAMSRSDYLADSDRRLKIQLPLYGAIGIIILYNLSLSFLLGNRIFLFNALTSASMLLLDMTISGFGSLFIWPEHPQVYDYALLLGVAGPTLFGPSFVFHFLKRDNQESFWRQPFFATWTGISMIVLASAFTLLPQWIGTGILVTMWIAMSLTFFAYLLGLAAKGSERASIILVPLLAAVFPPMFVGATQEYFGWNYGTIGNHHTQVALVMEALTFTLAVAYLIRLSLHGEVKALEQLNMVSNQTARRLVEVVDEERTRISRDLHDTAGQAFVLIANRLSRLGRDKKLPLQARSQISETERLIADILTEIRQTTHDMHPPALDHLGLRRALKNLLASFSNTEDFVVDFHFQINETQLSKNQSLQVFRIVQELVSNAAKHASASNAVVDMHTDQLDIVLTITDNGSWRKDIAAGNSKGIGLRIVAQRVEILQGKMQMNQHSDGTNLVIKFPISSDQAGNSDHPNRDGHAT